MQRSTLASAECFLEWQSADATHTDRLFFPKIDFWRDILPGDLGEQLRQGEPGATAQVAVAPGEHIPDQGAGAIHNVSRDAVHAAFRLRHLTGPCEGRFYPRGLLAGWSGLDNIFRQDTHPFRVGRIEEECVHVDLNHPLAGRPLKVGATLDQRLGTREERGGQCNDIVADIASMGPGMQGRAEASAASLVYSHAFNRADESDDAEFYRPPRLVHHIDARARSLINRIYREYIMPGMQVLDLMSSWESHLEGVADSVEITGLGMNATELAANPQLSAYALHNLNTMPVLPYDDASFDIVLCSASVEYLARPFEVFSEVGRVLRPGGHFIVSFSDRWFPPKVIQLWTEMHPFERMGLVLEYFRKSGRFHDLATESSRGWPRPEDDKYYPQRLLADPVYVVRGRRSSPVQ